MRLAPGSSLALLVASCATPDPTPTPAPANATAAATASTSSASQKSNPDSPAKAESKNISAAKQQPTPRIAALASKVYIYRRASRRSGELGTIRLGRSVDIAGSKPLKRADCEAGWYRVKPKGFVCLDRTTTLDMTHPIVVAKAAHRGDFSQALPLSWGESRETPVYRRVPTADEQSKYEVKLRKHLERVKRVRDAAQPTDRDLARLRGASARLVSGAAPAFLADHADSPFAKLHLPSAVRPRTSIVPPRSSVAWTDEFTVDGRSWLLTSDLLLVPKDKVKRYEPSAFRGVYLKDVQLPIAFIRHEDRPKYQLADGGSTRPASVRTSDATFIDDPRDSPGRLEKTDERFKRLSHVELTGRARWQRSKRYLETRDGGWIERKHAQVIKKNPPRGLELGADEKWLEISVFHGTLVAYVGETPVFATLISPGAAGYRSRTGPVKKNTTPSGTFRIEWKHRSTTMTPDPKRLSYYVTDVPYTQFFHMPFALHAAYWHNRFGEPKSGGCINLSPTDARWLFEWTAPRVPDDWHGVRSGAEFGPGTWVVVR